MSAGRSEFRTCNSARGSVRPGCWTPPGVEVLHDLPGVAANLHDHPMSGAIYEASQAIPVPESNNAEASALTWVDPDEPAPDLVKPVQRLPRTSRSPCSSQVARGPARPRPATSCASRRRCRRACVGATADPEPDPRAGDDFMFITVPFHSHTVEAPENSATIGVAVMQPDSRAACGCGRATRRPRPAWPPLPRRGARRAPDDRGSATCARGRTGRAFGAWRAREVLPGPEHRDEAVLRRDLRRGTGQYYHPVGTCRMGADNGAVVDPQLRVRGVEGLRVADASGMPTIVSGNTDPAAPVIGEKAADLLRA